MNAQKKGRWHFLSLRFPCAARLLSLLFILVLPAVVQAEFTFATNNGAITITGYTGTCAAVTIPANINGLPVTSIASYAFPGNINLTNVTIGAGITNIGDYAFSDCTSLTAINVDASNPDYNSVDGVLFDQTQTTLIQYPASKTGTCYAIPSGVLSIGDASFYDSQSLTNIAIPNSVTNIGLESFSGCVNLLAINIPSSVTSIGDWAFWYCVSLTTVTIPTSVNSIGGFAFSDCDSLSAVYFEGNAPSDGGGIFNNDNGVTVYYPPGTTGWSATFSGAPTVEETPPCQFAYVTNSDTASITITAYNGSNDAVAIPPNINGYPVTSIGAQAFQNDEVTNILIPNSITNIGNSAFAGCVGLTSVIIPSSILDIGDDAFAQCTNLTDAYFRGDAPPDDGTVFSGDPVTVYFLPGTIGWGGTFGGAPAIEEAATPPNDFTYVTNGNSITITGYTGPGGFVVIPDTIDGYSVNDIGPDAFTDNTNLVSITIPWSVTNVEDDAFVGCASLETAYFESNAPPDNGTVFSGDPVSVYYLFGTTGWSTTFGDAPAMQETSPNQFTWATNSDAVSVTITSYTGPGGSVVIPNTINGYYVTSVGSNAFQECTALISVTIPGDVMTIEFDAFGSCTGMTNVILPDSIISIGDESFNGCSSLTNLTIPNSVTSIGQDTFVGCTSLSSITIPNSVTNIEDDAFLYCTNMTNISVAADNPDYSSLDGILFDKAQDTLLECPSGLANTDYVIPDGVATIAENAFFYCPNLVNITIPGSLTNIIGPPFYDCPGLTNICVIATNPAYSSLNGVLFDKAQDTLIQYPPGLTNANYTIPNGVTTLQGDAFSDCVSLVNITIPNGVTNIGLGVFLGCTSLSSVIIPNGVTSIPQQAFAQCPNLASVIIPDSVTNIGLLAFNDCPSLASITIPSSVNNIGFLAFDSCASLTSAYFQGDAPAGGGGAFNGTPATVYYLPGTFGWGATFGNVPAVEETDPSQFTYATNNDGITITGYTGPGGTVVIPETINGYPVIAIGEFAFDSCTNLTSVTIPNGTTSIGNQSFLACANLANVMLPDTLTTIGSYAFQYCSSLSNVNIPASVTNIENFAFFLCSGLTNIAVDASNPDYSSSNGVLFNKTETTLIQYPLGLTNGNYSIPVGVTNIGAQAFDTCAGLTCVTIPNSVTTIGDYAFAYCFNLASVNIPGSITTIANEAFFYCTSLASITIPSSVTNVGNYAFAFSSSLVSAYFEGNAPPDNGNAFITDPATVYYLSGTTGWAATYGDVAVELWNPQAQNASVTAGQFGFEITGPTNAVIVIQACTNLANPIWIPVSTNTLDGNGTSSFSDSQGANYPSRFYRFTPE